MKACSYSGLLSFWSLSEDGDRGGSCTALLEEDTKIQRFLIRWEEIKSIEGDEDSCCSLSYVTFHH